MVGRAQTKAERFQGIGFPVWGSGNVGSDGLGEFAYRHDKDRA